ncbi:hypothetical protein JXA88_16845 [Candidatus Fermentibacteria bacterium]|nr:hypothetical protein [Candidatus Fermentibacteria bacterium]
MNRATITAIVVTSVVCLAGIAAVSQAEIPQTISYQGKVTDAAGNPVADGSYAMRFWIYDAATAGNVLWDSGVRSVTLAGGVFNVVLGESPQPALDLPFDQDYWLLVTFAGVNQTPRQRLTANDYSYMASGLVPGTTVTGELSILPGKDRNEAAIISAENEAVTGIGFGLCGSTTTPGGAAVLGLSETTVGDAAGLMGLAYSQHGIGVVGHAEQGSGTNYGVVGVSDSPDGFGGYFEGKGHFSGRVGIGTTTPGSDLEISNTVEPILTLRGLYGDGSASIRMLEWTGSLGIRMRYDGVDGELQFKDNSTGTQIMTVERGGNVGVGTAAPSAKLHAVESGGTVIYGENTATTGSSAYGVYGKSGSNSGTGVYGWTWATTGTTRGVHGTCSSPSGFAVYGYTTLGTGVYGGTLSTTNDGVYYAGGLAGSGTKSCVVRTSQGPTLMYCQESPENWFEDFGEGRLVNGRCRIELDPLFLETVTIGAANPMRVFTELGGDCRGVYVTRGTTGFDVSELQGGTSSVPITYRVMAKRKGFETKRLEVCEAARTDSYLYPELREKEVREREEMRARHEEERARLEEERARTREGIERMNEEHDRAEAARAERRLLESATAGE